MIASIYAMVATTGGTLSSLYPALIISISNCAPYFKNLSVKASTRLVQLFQAFSSPPFLLADEGHPRLVFFLLEAFNGILLHQLSNNPNLVYSILQSHKTFEELGTFTLAKGLTEIKRLRQLKEERAAAAKAARDAKDKSVSAASTPSSELKKDEKVGLLERDRETPRQSGEERRKSEEIEDDSIGTLSNSSSQILESGSSDTKGKGKMRESLSLDLDGDLDKIAAGIGRNGFIPTQEWVSSWQQGLPLDIILLTISELLPKIQEMQPATTSQIMDFLRSVTLDHVLPNPPPPFVARKFQWSDASIVWQTSLIWGEIYVRGTTPLAIWNSTNVRLFGVRHTPVPKSIVGETVSNVQNVVGGLWGGGTGSTGAQNAGNDETAPGSAPQTPSTTRMGHSRRASMR
jgi:hypothetical protein